VNLEEDYILRLIKNLQDAIKRIIHGLDQQDIEQTRLEINKAYELFGKPTTFFYKTNFEELIIFLNSKENYHLKKVDLLARLILINIKVDTSQKDNYQMLEKAKKLWEYYNEVSKEYSFEREENIYWIESLLKKSSSR
jgi:hypothetical protein